MIKGKGGLDKRSWGTHRDSNDRRGKYRGGGKDCCAAVLKNNLFVNEHFILEGKEEEVCGLAGIIYLGSGVSGGGRKGRIRGRRLDQPQPDLHRRFHSRCRLDTQKKTKRRRGKENRNKRAREKAMKR